MNKAYAGLGAAALLLNACASNPPTEALLAAQDSVTRAEQEQAAQFAAFELDAARDKLMAAQAAAQARDDGIALARAQEAQADAELASAKTSLSKTLGQAGQLQRSINLLQYGSAPGLSTGDGR